MLRATFFVDGFNLYHSLLAAENDLNAKGEACNTRWLDIHGLFQEWSQVIAQRLSSPTARLQIDIEKIFYFSAYANHREYNHPGCALRHQNYVKCLESQGIVAELGMFKRRNGGGWEEKETDVAIAVRLAEQSIRKLCDVAVIVSGDTDIAPAMRMVRQMCPELRIVTLFPYRRKNSELERLSDASVNINRRSYVKNQLADPFVLPDGTTVPKPPTW
jgi:uncharacterized LabA/DUF88 family protein